VSTSSVTRSRRRRILIFYLTGVAHALGSSSRPGCGGRTYILLARRTGKQLEAVRASPRRDDGPQQREVQALQTRSPFALAVRDRFQPARDIG